ncbi:MAG: hypothetical protein AAF363_11200 [Bacteroidota bacterium]
MITKAIEFAFEYRKMKGWQRTYWAFDIHGTILKPNWSKDILPDQFYPEAKECLQMISKIKEVRMILYTCSRPDHIESYLKFFESDDIKFHYTNSNPEIRNGAYACYDSKPYFNVLFEDKAGFDPYEDWIKVKELIKNRASF